MLAEPAIIPVTIPLASTVAIAALLVAHVPPLVESLKDKVAAGHIIESPIIEPGVGNIFLMLL